jgi:metallophosphoesterase superfamily enzyme
LRGRGSRRAPCFWFTSTRGVLPAFGTFTGCAMIRPGRGDRVFAVGDQQILEIPLPAAIDTQ